MRRKFHVLAAFFASGALTLAACAGGSTSLTPATNAGGGNTELSYSQNGSNLTITGPVTSIQSSTEFTVQAGRGCGYLHVFTNGSTTYSPTGAKIAVGEQTTDSGTGNCSTSLTATSVTVSSTPAPTPTPTPGATPSPLPASVTVGAGEIFGLDDTFNPTDGNSASGGQGQTVDPGTAGGLPCVATMPNTYHVHAFVGLIVNGRQYALPDGIGMKNPGGDITYAGFPNWTEYASCYYYIHTHDASGVFHIESPQSVPPTQSIYTLQNAFDVWGQPISSSGFGPFAGTVTAYVAEVPLKTDRITASMYTTYSGNPATIPLKSHTTVWLQIGPQVYTPAQLPVINYEEEY